MHSVVGLITEYNPFHKGHLYHLEQAKKNTGSDYAIAVMSGNFVQRGEPAFLNKWVRTKMALLNGVDLVLELPAAYALRSAEYFAFGGIKILEACGIVNYICFGSESDDLSILKKIAAVLVSEPYLYKQSLKEFLNQGFSYAKSREKAVARYIGENDKDIQNIEAILRSPNNILGIEYIKNLMKLQSSIEPTNITRIGSGYHEFNLSTEIASATAIRKHLLKEVIEDDLVFSALPTSSSKGIKDFLNSGQNFTTLKDFEKPLLYALRLHTESSLSKFSEITEGLEFRIMSSIKKFSDIHSIIENIKSKRYTYTKINRILMHILLNLQKDTLEYFDHSGGPQYIRVLGFTEKGRKLLSHMKDFSSLPIVTNIGGFSKKSSDPAARMLQLDVQASNIYFLAQKDNAYIRYNADFNIPVIYIKNP